MHGTAIEAAGMFRALSRPDGFRPRPDFDAPLLRRTRRRRTAG
ncbi:hypothetical protein ABT330_20830 [Streptomyces sp. NPDC000658]